MQYQPPQGFGDPPPAKRRRLDREEREAQILKGAVKFFAEHGFTGATRDLTQALGISKGLLYRYYPSKDVLFDRIYEEVFMTRWKDEWSTIIADRGVALPARLRALYLDYSTMLHDHDWVRIYLFAGLADSSINQRFWTRVKERIYDRVIDEIRFVRELPAIDAVAMTEPELELITALHGSLFYIGVRKWVHKVTIPRDVDGAVTRLVDGFYANALRLPFEAPASANGSRIHNGKRPRPSSRPSDAKGRDP